MTSGRIYAIPPAAEFGSKHEKEKKRKKAMMTLKDFKGSETAFMTIRAERKEPEVRECAILKIGKLYVTAKINEYQECRFKNVRGNDDFLSCRNGYREYRLFPTRQLAEADVNRDKLINDIQNAFMSYSNNKYKYTVEQLQRILSITQEGKVET